MQDTLNRIWGLVVKEVLQLSRDKLLLGFLILGPLLELALMGGLTGEGVKNLPLAVGDLLWVQVDSANAGSDYGAVWELDEANNVLGPLTVTEVGDPPGLTVGGTIVRPRPVDALPGR